MRGMVRLGLAVAVVCLAACGRDGATAPSSLPTVLGRTTALANLNAIERLEHGLRPQSRLIDIKAVVDPSGIPTPASSWTYVYREPFDVTDGYYSWNIDSSGRLTGDHFIDDAYRRSGRSVMTVDNLRVDSDRAVGYFYSYLGGSPTARSIAQPTFSVTYAHGLSDWVGVMLVIPNCPAGVGVSVDAATGSLAGSSGTCALPRPNGS